MEHFRFQLRAKAVRLARLAATGLWIGLPQLLRQTSRWSSRSSKPRAIPTRGAGGAKYRRISSAPVEAMHTNPAFIHAASDVNVSGGSWWQIVPDEGGFNYFQFGAVNDVLWNYQTATDNTPMMLKFQQYMYSDYGWFEDIRELRV